MHARYKVHPIWPSQSAISLVAWAVLCASLLDPRGRLGWWTRQHLNGYRDSALYERTRGDRVEAAPDNVSIAYIPSYTPLNACRNPWSLARRLSKDAADLRLNKISRGPAPLVNCDPIRGTSRSCSLHF
ncbi:hypothetical protein GGR53DRAFT_334007 [Hypoxylon sp. FL1150]|nr:hypothetical protein GGR53DRAFT_334007 [Hypoxylon sp. FL1150]